MKFSLIAVAFAIAFAVTSHAAELNLLTREEKCHGLSITYGSCYNVSEFGKVTAADFVSKDNNNKGITLIFFESGNCGGKYTKISGYWPAESWQYWSQINYVSGNIKSVWMMNTYEAPGKGRSDNYWTSIKVSPGACRNYPPVMAHRRM